MNPSLHEPMGFRPGARLLDRYVVIDVVAAGGMSTIYRAEDERLGRVVCVKLFRPTPHETSFAAPGE